MKKNIKKLLVLLCMVACVFGVTACGSDTKQTSQKTLQYDEAGVKEFVRQIIGELSSYTDEQLEMIKEGPNMDEGTVGLIDAWMKVREELGEYREIISFSTSSTAKTFIVDAELKYSKRDAELNIIFNEESVISSSFLNVKYSLAEKMGRAGLNTVIGMGTVFAVLIFLTCLFSVFKVINKIENKAKNNVIAPEIVSESVDNAIAQIIQKEEEELNDLELVSVITAAIAAYEGTPADGLVVRSIKKSNKSKWQNAI
jgi:sodium pump decarboxylase gamma subunit